MDGLSISALIFTVYFSALSAYGISKRKNMDTGRVFYINLIVLYGILLFVLSVFPLPFEDEKGLELVPLRRLLIAENKAPALLSYLTNFLLYVPLGFFYHMQGRLKGDRVFVRMLLSAMLAAVTAEFLQLMLPLGRFCGTDDMIAATLGALLGYAAFALVSRTPSMRKFMRNILYR